MSGAEQAVRDFVAQKLRGDAAVMAAVHGVYEAAAARMTPPYVRIDAAEGRVWGMKDRAGREVMLMLSLGGPAMSGRAGVAAVDAALQDVRGAAAGWDIVASQVMRSRWSEKGDGSGQQLWTLRCRCLAAA